MAPLERVPNTSGSRLDVAEQGAGEDARGPRSTNKTQRRQRMALISPGMSAVADRLRNCVNDLPQ